MPGSQPLTNILQGHEIVSAKRGEGCVMIALSGGYNLIVATSGMLPKLPKPAGRIAEGWHEGKILRFDMEDARP